MISNLHCSCRINQMSISIVEPLSLTNVPLIAVTGMKLSPLFNMIRSMHDSEKIKKDDNFLFSMKQFKLA